jgi:hypothetical protein
MRTSRVELLTWLPRESENIEIDWPKVHKAIGTDHLEWLLKQPKNKCQIMLERKDVNCRLIAEFYDQKVLAIYHLMWAK